MLLSSIFNVGKVVLSMKVDLPMIRKRQWQDFEEEVKEINRKLENLCKGKVIKFINNNNNIDGSCLNRGKLHLNKGGTALLVKRFLQALKSNWLCNFNDSVANKTANFASANNTSNFLLSRNLRIKNP